MRTARAIGFLVLALAGAALVWFGAGSIRAARRARTVETAWARSFGPLESITAKFPAHPTNASAHALEESARSLGIELRPRGEQPVEDGPCRSKSFDPPGRNNRRKERGSCRPPPRRSEKLAIS